MTVTGIITALVIGPILGFLGRVAFSGRVAIPVWLTVLTGVGAAIVGTLLARVLGVPTATNGIDWLELLFQVVTVTVGVAVVSNLYGRSSRAGLGGSAIAPPPARRTVSPNPSVDPQRGSRIDPPATPRARPQTAAQTFAPWEPAAPRRMQQPVPPAPPPSRVFVSYRRSDARHAARGIAERLRSQFGPTEVFMDVDSLAKGADFVEGGQKAVRASAVVLVLIGDRWLSVVDERGVPRLDDPADNVRMEIEQALQWRKHVLPVLLDGVGMPRSDDLPASLARFPRLNGVHLNHESWDDDVAALVREVARLRP